MSVMTADLHRERAEAVRFIVQQLRILPESSATDFLNIIAHSSPSESIMGYLATDKTRRSHLKLIAFPRPRTDRAAIDAALEAGNTIESMWHLAAGTTFEYNGRVYAAQVLKNPNGTWRKTKTNVLRVVYSAKRLTECEKRALR